jgi:hypothetical protein
MRRTVSRLSHYDQHFRSLKIWIVLVLAGFALRHEASGGSLSKSI